MPVPGFVKTGSSNKLTELILTFREAESSRIKHNNDIIPLGQIHLGVPVYLFKNPAGTVTLHRVSKIPHQGRCETVERKTASPGDEPCPPTHRSAIRGTEHPCKVRLSFQPFSTRKASSHPRPKASFGLYGAAGREQRAPISFSFGRESRVFGSSSSYSVGKFASFISPWEPLKGRSPPIRA